MKQLKFVVFLFLLPIFVQAQFSNNSQVSIPVYFNDNTPSSQRRNVYPTAELSGIALMLFENQDEEDNILLSRLGDPILWMEQVGISSKATFVFPELDGVSSMEVLLSNSRLMVSFSYDDDEIAKGAITQERDKFIMNLVGDETNEGGVKKILDKANNYLMRLHLKQQKKILIRPGFNQDTLNVICGYDTQFDTDFDVIWLNTKFYERLTEEAQAAHLHLSSNDSLGGSYNERVESSAIVEHSARLSESDNNVLYGSIVVNFEVMGGKDYYFLKGQERYQIAIDYYYRRKKNGKPSISIEKLMLRNVQSGDFIEMSILDLTSSTLPIIYVDLINSVIMDDYGTWNLVQVFTVFEDIFDIIDLPNERS